MPRVTRSKKVEIVEDNTAFSVGDQTAPSVNTNSHSQPLGDAIGNTMNNVDIPVEVQLKDLKAAYRVAIGVTKKGNHKNKASIQQKSEDAELIESHGVNVQVREDIHEDSQGRLDPRTGGPSLHDNLNQKPEDKVLLIMEDKTEQLKDAQHATKANITEQQPIIRITRRQAKAQEGPYNDLLENVLGRQNDSPPEEQHRGIDFVTSLFAGRYAGPSRSLNNSVSTLSKFGRTANDYLFLAEEALRKASREVRKETATTQATEENISWESIPTKLEENTQSHQAPQRAMPETTITQADNECEDSFVEQITCRSPAKPVSRLEKSLELRVDNATQSPAKLASGSTKQSPVNQASDEVEDSFVEHIVCRSPAKQSSRIEDSVEALDQMEEVEEALQEATMAERFISPEKKRQTAKEQPTKQSVVVATKVARGTTATKQPQIKSGYASMRAKPSAPRPTAVIKKATSMTFKPPESTEMSNIRDEVGKVFMKKAPVKRPISLLPPKEPVKSAKPVTRPTNFELPGESIARKLKEQREARLARRDSSAESFHTARAVSGPSVKSTKPLTKPAFQLPGEAVSLKKREAHEAKLKAQEEEERKRREFKAKPVRKSTIRDTAASRARQSKIGVDSMGDGNLTVSKRGSNIGAHRPSILELHNIANTSAPRVAAPAAPAERKPSAKFHGPTMSGLAMQRTVSASEVLIQRQRAKELYTRDQRLTEDIEKDKRDREAAAKRSREEAAEKGRQASREWAEKQRVKKLAEGDKGMGPGYGPGGQLGLRQ